MKHKIRRLTGEKIKYSEENETLYREWVMYEEEKQDLLKKTKTGVESQALTRELETAIASPFLMEGPDEARFASRNFQRVACVTR